MAFLTSTLDEAEWSVSRSGRNRTRSITVILPCILDLSIRRTLVLRFTFRLSYSRQKSHRLTLEIKKNQIGLHADLSGNRSVASQFTECTIWILGMGSLTVTENLRGDDLGVEG
jgi:hypothetical protein